MKKLRARGRGSSAQMTECLPQRLWMAGLLLTLLAGCATSPVAQDSDQVIDIGPAHVLEGRGSSGDQVVWGGRIVAVRNLANQTEISVVSYPLDGADRPRTDAEPGVRFLIRQAGFLEPVKYARGRFLTALGTIGVTEQVTIDEYLMTQPVLHAERIHLWPADMSRWTDRTRFSVGVGISL